MSIPNLSIEISANSVAWYGAIVATAGIFLSYFNYQRDRAKIKIKYEPDMYIIGGSSLNYPEGVKHISITVTNVGRRPVKIEKASLKLYGESKIYMLSDSFSDRRPKVITEESPVTSFHVKQELINTKKVYCVMIADATGKVYKKYVKKFPTMKLIYYWIIKKITTKKDGN